MIIICFAEYPPITYVSHQRKLHESFSSVIQYCNIRESRINFFFILLFILLARKKTEHCIITDYRPLLNDEFLLK